MNKTVILDELNYSHNESLRNHREHFHFDSPFTRLPREKLYPHTNYQKRNLSSSSAQTIGYSSRRSRP